MASDNVGVAGYDLYLNGQHVLSTRNNSATIGDLLDDQSFEVMVKTRDFAGNRSVNNPQISFRTKPFTTKDGLVCLKTTTPIVIDGLEDAVWDQYAWQSAEKILMGSIDNEQDLSVKFKLAWDENAIYLLTRIIDDAKVRDSGDNLFLDDDLEVYFDMDNSKSSYYDLGDFHYRFTFQDSLIVETQFNAVKGITYVPRIMEDGYQTEIAFPWSVLNSRAKNGKLIGFDLQVNDDDDGGIRDGKLGWWANSDNARPSLFGQVKMRLFPTYLETSVSLPDNFMLLNAYPNPFNGQVTIKIELSAAASVQLDLFDLNGRRLNTIYQGKLQAGQSQFQLDLADKASGLYFVRLVNAHTGQSQTIKVVMIK
ncbi:MAG TPA: T9SS type A sorting domain-containing protein [Caldithrix abyssi]|uniref:T9SS type A sorting domain-containing protein n=1 Tax=Caldithrix abyssi TaxID=187145 RepID=A0A7V5H259_CALAY|nr:T9SS type A sorting domain-containing protein [Caldithrix abyssi]